MKQVAYNLCLSVLLQRIHPCDDVGGGGSAIKHKTDFRKHSTDAACLGLRLGKSRLNIRLAFATDELEFGIYDTCSCCVIESVL